MECAHKNQYILKAKVGELMTRISTKTPTSVTPSTKNPPYVYSISIDLEKYLADTNPHSWLQKSLRLHHKLKTQYRAYRIVIYFNEASNIMPANYAFHIFIEYTNPTLKNYAILSSSLILITPIPSIMNLYYRLSKKHPNYKGIFFAKIQQAFGDISGLSLTQAVILSYFLPETFYSNIYATLGTTVGLSILNLPITTLLSKRHGSFYFFWPMLSALYNTMKSGTNPFEQWIINRLRFNHPNSIAIMNLPSPTRLTLLFDIIRYAIRIGLVFTTMALPYRLLTGKDFSLILCFSLFGTGLTSGIAAGSYNLYSCSLTSYMFKETLQTPMQLTANFLLAHTVITFFDSLKSWVQGELDASHSELSETVLIINLVMIFISAFLTLPTLLERLLHYDQASTAITCTAENESTLLEKEESAVKKFIANESDTEEEGSKSEEAIRNEETKVATNSLLTLTAIDMGQNASITSLAGGASTDSLGTLETQQTTPGASTASITREQETNQSTASLPQTEKGKRPSLLTNQSAPNILLSRTPPSPIPKLSPTARHSNPHTFLARKRSKTPPSPPILVLPSSAIGLVTPTTDPTRPR